MEHKARKMTKEDVKRAIRDIPDFPSKGIVFKDLTTAFKDPNCMKWFEEQLYKRYKDLGITKIVGIESRGFVVAPILGNRLGVGFVPMRKKGKLPAETVEISYTKEYGEDIIELHKDSLTEDDVILIHDDLLATGGTTEAAAKLVEKQGAKVTQFSFLIGLKDLHGEDKLKQFDAEVYSILNY